MLILWVCIRDGGGENGFFAFHMCFYRKVGVTFDLFLTKGDFLAEVKISISNKQCQNVIHLFIQPKKRKYFFFILNLGEIVSKG
jgi:hypothetical protein